MLVGGARGSLRRGARLEAIGLIGERSALLHRHTLASEALPRYLKIVSKHATERVNFIRARARLFKVLYKDELIDLQY